MTHKLRSEMSSQKIDTSADIIFGSLALLEGFVILDLNLLFSDTKLKSSWLIAMSRSEYDNTCTS